MVDYVFFCTQMSMYFGNGFLDLEGWVIESVLCTCINKVQITVSCPFIVGIFSEFRLNLHSDTILKIFSLLPFKLFNRLLRTTSSL